MSKNYEANQPARSDIDALAVPLVIEFGTAWCGYCMAAQPLIESALNEYPALRHLKVEDGPGHDSMRFVPLSSNSDGVVRLLHGGAAADRNALNEYPALRHLKVEDGPGRPLGRSFRVKLWPTLIFMAMAGRWRVWSGREVSGKSAVRCARSPIPEHAPRQACCGGLNFVSRRGSDV